MHNMNLVRMLDFAVHGDARGKMTVVEGGTSVPFDIKRLFYIYGTQPNVMRGQHANKRSEFVLINVSGHSKVKVLDGEGNEVIYVLNRPHTGIYLPRMVWKEMYDFSEDSVLLVLAGTHYDPEGYVRNYDDFVKLVTAADEAESAE